MIVLALVAAAFLLGRSSKEGGSAAVGTPWVGEGGFATLATHRCPTELAIGQPHTSVAQRIAAPIPATLGPQLTAYVDSAGTVLVAPRGWECTATMGADGTEQIGAVPPGAERAPWSSEAGDPVVDAELVPACAGCISSLICGFFPHAEVVQFYAEYEDCAKAPQGERVLRVSRSTVLFADPPEVHGTGTGSGGSLPSAGGVTYARDRGARRLSCTLPAPLADACTSILDANLLMSGT